MIIKIYTTKYYTRIIDSKKTSGFLKIEKTKLTYHPDRFFH